ncbi:hypothetical protein GN958_ATG13262, partial [Phytophthora infestans]
GLQEDHEIFLLDLVSVRGKRITQDRRKKRRAHSHNVGASTGHGAEHLHTIPPQASISITTIDSTTSEGYNQPPSTQSQTVLRVKKKRGSKTIKIYKGFKYTKSWASTKILCTDVVRIITSHGEWRVVGDHNCRKDVLVNGSLRNETGAMQEMTDRLAADDPGMPKEAIWERICSEFYGPSREELIEGLTEEQVESRVRRVRRRYYGGAIHGVVEVPPSSKVRDSAIQFFRFHLVTAHPEPNAPPNRIRGWAHPALKELLLYNSVSLYIDGTFRCVHRGFYQCLIVMVDDPARNVYTP